MANKIKLVVGGMDYIIQSDDDESYIRNIGDELNRRLEILSRKNPYLSTAMVAMLAALEFCDEAKKAQQEIEQLRLQHKSTLEELACSRLEADEAKREIERLGKENRMLRDKLENR
ncbi:MAG TPA: cell division protein ZapA [Clostridiales bacterium]|nr:cell division protein ZapA [Clostridiales bacterium]